MQRRYFKTERVRVSHAAFALVIAGTALSGCQSVDILPKAETMHNGYIFDQESLNLVPVGSSREQVLLSLGTPSTTATFDNEVFYYISQTRTRAAAFMKPRLVSQNILAIYFNKDGVVEKRANYTLKDGKVFDMVSRTTPTGGKDLTFLQQLLSRSSTSGAAAAKNTLNQLGNQLNNQP